MNDLVIVSLIIVIFLLNIILVFRVITRFLFLKKIIKSNCYDCNIVEAFRETMLEVLELLNNNEVEEAKEVMRGFLNEEE